jgi:LacI family transcriptional regulator
MKKKECKSIYDLAEITGVSYATVSRVLNNRGRTSETTRKAVLKAAADYNFKPKMKARNKTIGIVTPLDHMIKREFYGYIDTILMHLLNELSIKGYSIEFFSSHNINSLQNCLLDGLICCGWNDQIGETMKRMPTMPVILVNGKPVAGCSRVHSDHEQSGRMAAEYLIEKGHTKAGIIFDCRLWGNKVRAEGFKKVFEEKGLSFDPVLQGYLSEQTETIMVKNMLSSGASAFFLAGEDFILPVKSTIQMMNEQEKRPLTVISMENSCFSRYQNPPMTTIAQPFNKMVEKTIELLETQINKGVNHPQDIKLENSLIIRNSDVFSENS